jgi:hypothetical protein
VRLDDNEISISGTRRADVTGVSAWEPSCRGFGIAKILEKLQLHPRQGWLGAVANGLPDKTTSPYNNYLCRTDERAWIARSSLPPIM